MSLIENGQVKPAIERVRIGARKVNPYAGTSRGDLSKQWIARPHDQRFVKLSDLLAYRKRRFEASSQDIIDNNQLKLIAPEVSSRDDLHRLTVGYPGHDNLALTNWSFNQICALARAPAGHYRTLPSPIVRDALNYSIRFNRAVEQIKVYADDDEVMAANGPDYGRIPDWEVVAAVMNVAGEGNGDTKWKVPGLLDWSTHIYDPMIGQPVTPDRTTIFGSDRDIFIFLVDDTHPIEVGKLADGSPDYVFRGFYIKNSEVGRTTCVIAAFYLRGICCNRMMWGVEGFQEVTIRHTKYAPDRFVEVARPALDAFANGTDTKLIEGVKQAKAAKLADDDKEAVAFLKGRGLSGQKAIEVMEWVQTNEDHPARSAWDFAQGMTGIARDIPFQDQRVDLENEAGKLLDNATGTKRKRAKPADGSSEDDDGDLID